MQRKPLKHRDYEVDLESRLGKTQVCSFVSVSFLELFFFLNVCLGHFACKLYSLVD